MPKIKFFTLGCKVNQYETQSIREKFLARGFIETGNKHPADTYLINTCTVTHQADNESLSLVRKAHRENPKAKIIVTGCLTQLDEKRIKGLAGRITIIRNAFKDTISSKGISTFKGHSRAFLKIQDGCNNLCSYCKVPLVRGPSVSREKKEIIEEARRLGANGFKEIVLTGICLGAFGRDLNPKITLAELLEGIQNIDGIKRIRLSSIEAKDITDELIALIGKSRKICPHLHIPLQSGDDEVLKKMNRKYSQKDFLLLIRKIRKQIPAVAITTDCLVGFPGESERQFKNTLKMVKMITPLKTHVFPYSSRRGTKAYDMAVGEASAEITKTRARELREAASCCALEFMSGFLGKNMAVLVEGKAKPDSGYWVGHTGNYMQVKFDCEESLKNNIVEVRLKKIAKDGSILASYVRRLAC